MSLAADHRPWSCGLWLTRMQPAPPSSYLPATCRPNDDHTHTHLPTHATMHDTLVSYTLQIVSYPAYQLSPLAM